MDSIVKREIFFLNIKKIICCFFHTIKSIKNLNIYAEGLNFIRDLKQNPEYICFQKLYLFNHLNVN